MWLFAGYASNANYRLSYWTRHVSLVARFSSDSWNPSWPQVHFWFSLICLHSACGPVPWSSTTVHLRHWQSGVTWPLQLQVKDMRPRSYPAGVTSQGISPAPLAALLPSCRSSSGSPEIGHGRWPHGVGPGSIVWHYYRFAGSARMRTECPGSGCRRRQWRRCEGNTGAPPAYRSCGEGWSWRTRLPPSPRFGFRVAGKEAARGPGLRPPVSCCAPTPFWRSSQRKFCTL